MLKIIGTFTIGEPRTVEEKRLAGQQGVTFVRDEEGRSWYEVVEGLRRRKSADHAHYGIVALGEVRIASADPTTLFPAWSNGEGQAVPATVVASSEPVVVGHLFNGSDLAPAPGPTLAEAKRAALSKVAEEHAETLRRMTGGATIEERDTWTEKRRWAAAYQAGDASFAPLLVGMLTDAEREAAGERAADAMAGKIIAQAHRFSLLTVAAERSKREAEKAVEGAGTIAALDAILGRIAEEKAAREAAFLEGQQAA